jgi:ubiquinone/menaquinone biosynthesis C-methylase UbiE
MEINILNWRLRIERVIFEEGELADMYDRAAGRWSQSIQRMGYLHAYDRLFRGLCDDGTLAGLPPAAYVLDAGIGTGEMSAALVRRQPDILLCGIDISETMIATVQERLKGDFRCGTLAALPYPDASFDLVMSAHALEHMSAPDVGIYELMRVLKPGGRFVIVATRQCPVTSMLSLRWNFKPMSQSFITGQLTSNEATSVIVASLMPRTNLAYMSIVYSGCKGGITFQA